MKYLGWALVFLALLASGCTEAGMLAGGEGACRIVNESYMDMADLDANVLGVGREMSWSSSLGYYIEASLEIENRDNESGWFVVTFSWFRQGERSPYTEKKSIHLEPGEVGSLKSVCPGIDPSGQVFLTYTYDSYPDSKRLVERQREKKVCS